MKMHIEYDDFGEYLEICADGELYVAEEYSERKTVELILFREPGAA